ncbi:hypothetical protein Glove_99g335 [Diversispora epigaea]|uniref:Uncharacterized protein n=1 Tax=Diversispora epigaea TaxID=1348612 RepID=A0A397J4D8_9GLOM|nr:hypothetical protein Glove_99g335 [Diversispora epigaea]
MDSNIEEKYFAADTTEPSIEEDRDTVEKQKQSIEKNLAEVNKQNQDTTNPNIEKDRDTVEKQKQSIEKNLAEGNKQNQKKETHEQNGNKDKDLTPKKSDIATKMGEKCERYRLNLIYVAVAALAMLIVWLRFKGWFDTFDDTKDNLKEPVF